MNENRGILVLKSVLESLLCITSEQSEQLLQQVSWSYAEVKKGDVLFRAGSPATHVGFVISGLFKVCLNTAEGGIYIKTFIQENDFVGPYSSIIEKTVSRFDFQAIEDSKIILINVLKVRELLQPNSIWETFGRKVAEKFFCEREKKEIFILTTKAKERYEYFLEKHKNLLDRVSQKDIANYLAIDPVTLSRLK